MSQFIETIKCLNGEVQNLAHHQDRLNHTFAKFFPKARAINLRASVSTLNLPHELSKCRLCYGKNEFSWQILPYQIKSLDSLKIVIANDLEYTYKFEDRTKLGQLYSQRQSADDIIIIKKGMVTDSYYANLVFYDGKNWYTPAQPLLHGVKRRSLLENQVIKEVDIHMEDLYKYHTVSLINAMLDIGEVALPTDQIIH